MLDFCATLKEFLMTMKLPRRFGIALALIVVLANLVSVTRLDAAPPALECNPGNAAITSPQQDSVLNGTVQIEGTVSLGAAFNRYKLEFSPAGRDEFHLIGSEVRQQVANGQLGVWDSASVPDGTYSIRVRVVDATGNYCEAVITGLRVQNAEPIKPTDSPTPVETEVTPEFAVVPTAVPTIQIGVPTEPSNAATPTRPAPAGSTRTPSPNVALPGGFNVDSLFEGLGQVFGGLLRTFLFGAMTMAGIMLIVGVIFYVRRVL